MQQLPAVLACHKGNWQRFNARRYNERFLALQPKIFNRDKNTCRYCGLTADKYQVVVNHDHNYSNNKASNLVTACIFCAQCFFLDSIGKNNNTGGYIIYLPEISQSDLNHFCRVLFTSMLRDAPYKGKLHSAYISLKDRAKTIDDMFGPNSSNPNVFGQALIDSDLSEDLLNSETFHSLRLLPDRRQFSEQIAYWKTNIFDQIPL